ncbi:D-alanyl-D-alanine carboxypeptidase/D-alanyl-D-alanine-endopeptidase [Ottowia sp.]|uniref:D-alanyl-D-alanine carboxypeptidase/D-alanyl-D-alanine endopeptidase n=1 Tax=Ottowia sp. TaxID=1898956 RepID=UPI002629E1D8|nr:D-alanyl-D-alanine carboxypeptidase/D-alanyl-D-alanine-endopeptidase [Ottowia sp.]
MRRLPKFLARAALAAAMLWLAGGTAAQTPLPPDITDALAKAGVPPQAVAMVVAPLPPPPGAVSRAPEPVNPSGERNAAPAPQPLPPPRLAWQPDVPMNPASVTKLFTTYMALDLLGPGYFWKTRVSVQGFVKDGTLQGNLLVKGSGDPKLVVERLQDLINAIRARGIRDINGDIVLDDGIFRLPPHDAAAFDDDPLRPYNAGPDGLLVNFGALVFKFQPDAGGRTARVVTEPPVAGIEVPTEVPLAKGCGDWRGRLDADFSDPRRIRFNGRYGAACGERDWAIAYPDAGHFAERVFEGMWRASGGGLSGRVRTQRGAPPGQPWVTGLSLPLAQIIADVNKLSNNVMAQQVFLTLSAAGDGHGSFGESQNAFARWWRQRFGVRKVPHLDNGSGLSRDARTTAASLAALLQQAASGPNAAVFADSLSIAGVDGTTRRMSARNPGSEAIGNARLKTGSLRDVAAVAGYAYGRSGQTWVVVGIVNHPNAPAARPALDRLVEWAVQDVH